MSASGNLGQRPEVYYSPFETGGSGSWSVRRPQPKDSRAFFSTPPSETEQHLQRAHDVMARIRQAVHAAH